MTPFDLPPQLHGTPEQQLSQLRAYLQRIILQMNEERKDA